MTQLNFNHQCERLLDRYNSRNRRRDAQRLAEIRDAIGYAGYEPVQTMFGGSVKRGTDITGISDVDALLIVNDTQLVSRPPRDAIERVRRAIKDRFPDNEVSSGKLAVTIEYVDGTEIQILPAIRTDTGGLRIAAHGGSEWSKITKPEAFAKKLTAVDVANGARVIPVIKLVKAIADCHIGRPSRKLSGYHIESLAIDAFSGYEGELKNDDMLDHFLTYSMDAVMSRLLIHRGNRGSLTNTYAMRVPHSASELKRTLDRCEAI